jgi:hypothetical protein
MIATLAALEQQLEEPLLAEIALADDGGHEALQALLILPV